MNVVVLFKTLIISSLVNWIGLKGQTIINGSEMQLLCGTQGIADCEDLTNIQCSQNYFRSTHLNIQFCVLWYNFFQTRSPYQNYVDSLTLYCMDCVENPYTWDISRRCTYDYQILNGDIINGVYTRVNRSSTELYYVDLSQLAPILPVTYLCYGCDQFCYNTTVMDASSNCYIITNPHSAFDPGHSTLKCLAGFYADSAKGVCQKCVDNCLLCDANGCLSISQGFYYDHSFTSIKISQCKTKVPFCESCYQDETFNVICQFCQQTFSGTQYIVSLNMRQCELCEAYCSRCMYTTYNTTILHMNEDNLIYPTSYIFTNSFIQSNSQQYIKKCLQCSIFNYLVSYDGISCVLCSIQNCQLCYYTYYNYVTNKTHSTLDYDFVPTTQTLNQLCYSCLPGYALSPLQDFCYDVTGWAFVQQNCSAFINVMSSDGVNYVTVCQKCKDTFFYNLNTYSCQLHDPNAVTLTYYTFNNGIYTVTNQTQAQQQSLVDSLSYITCSTQLSNCVECYMYASIDNIFVPSPQIVTQPYVYQCVRCISGYYADYFSGLCIQCKTSDQTQSCQNCSQYSLTINYTTLLQSYPIYNTIGKAATQQQYPPIVKPQCYSCIMGFSFIPSIKDCGSCGNNCFTGSCQNTLTESYCTRCWPPLQSYIQRSLSKDHSNCYDCPDYCEACRDRTQAEINSVNIDFNPNYNAFIKYSRFCYKPAYGTFYDTILGMPVQCGNLTNNKCKHTITLDIQLFCLANDYVIATSSDWNLNQNADFQYSLQGFYSSNFGTAVIQFYQIDQSQTYAQYNSWVLQELLLNVNFIDASDGSLCTIQQETQLVTYFAQNVFSLKNLVLTLQGNATFNQSYINQSSNTIIASYYFLNLFYQRNVIIRGLTFLYPLDCTNQTKNQMADNTVYPWGLAIKQNQLAQLMIVNTTFGANAAYLIQMNFTNLFSTNDKLLFKFTMNNVYNLTLINVNINYNNYTNMKNTNPLTRTFDSNVTKLVQRITYIDGLNITGLGLYGVPLFLANDVPTISQIFTITGNGLSFYFCNFYQGGHIFSEPSNSSTQSGQFNISRIVLQYSTFDQSSIFYLATNINNGTFISNVDIIDCNFTDSSYAFYLNNFQLVNIFAYKVTISNQSSIIKTQNVIPDDDNTILSNSLNQSLSQIQFSSIICQTSACLISMTSPTNMENLKTNITINGLIVQNTHIDGIESTDLFSITTALFQFLDVGTLVIANFYSNNNLAVAIIRIDQVFLVKLYNFLFDWTDAVANEQQILTNSSLVNSLIPVTIACLQNKMAARQFNNIQIYIDSFKFGVYMQNVTIQNLLSLDNRLISINSYNNLEVNTTVLHPKFMDYLIQDLFLNTSGVKFLSDNSSEIINIIGCNFINNRLVVSQTNTLTTIIYIYSQQYQIITFINCVFQSNHLHQLATFQNVISTTCISIGSMIGNVAILRTNFTSNAATKTHYGLIYIMSTQTIFSQSRFINTNIYDQVWNRRLQPNNMNSSQFQYYFYVIAKGGNAYITSLTIKIQYTSFNQSFGSSGAGLYLKALDSGNISIEYSTFESQASNLELPLQSQGGAVYIDSSDSKLTLNIQDTQMNKCQARISGGCIYILPGSQEQYITIKRSTFTNCYALQTSFMEVLFPTISTSIPAVEFDEINISQELFGLEIFYQQIPEFYQYDFGILSFDVAVYFQNFGSFTLSNSIIHNIFYSQAIHLTNMIQIDLLAVKIQDSTLFLAPLLNMQMFKTSAQTMITNLWINNIDVYISNKKSKCKQNPSIVSNMTGIQCISQQSLSSQNQNSTTLQNSSVITMNITNLTCLNISTVVYNSRYSQPYQTYYQSLNNTQKYSSQGQIIQDQNIPSQDQLSYQQNINNATNNLVLQAILQNKVASKNMACILNQELSLVNEQNQTGPTALIYIPGVLEGQSLNVTQLVIQNNLCLRCYGGLMQVIGINSQLGDPLVQLSDIKCINNTAGFYGCLTFTSNNIISPITVNGYKSNSQRILTQDHSTYQLKQQNNERILLEDQTLIRFQNQTLSLIIKDAEFVNNTALVGAGLSIIGLNSFIFHSQFIDNNAKYAGGGLFFYNISPSSVDAKLSVYDTQFIGNQAQVGGAVMLIDVSLGDVTLWNLKFLDNVGTEYAPNLAESPQQLSIQISQGITLSVNTFLNYSGDRNSFGNIKNKSVPIKDFVNVQPYQVNGYPGNVTNLVLPSGQTISSYKYYHQETKEWVPFNYILRVINLDRQHQKIQNIASNQYCTVSGRRQSTTQNPFYNDTNPFYFNYTSIGRIYFSTDIGAYDLDNMAIIFDPKLPQTEYLQLRFSCTSVKIPVYNQLPPFNITDYNTNYVLYVNVSTFPCQFGEYYTKIGGDDGRCLICPDGSQSYSVDPASSGCLAIDRSKMLNVTSTMIQVLPGYWRPYDNNAIVAQCLNQKASCLGGWQSGQNSCYDGHIGALCESCDLKGTRNGESWATSSPYYCGKCSDLLAQNTLIILGISLLTLLSIIASVYDNYEVVETFILNQILRTMGVLVKTSISSLAVMIKIFTNYFQIITVVSSFQLSLPSALSSTVANIGNPVKSMTVSYDCFFQTMSNLEVLYFRMIWALLIPFFYLCLIFLAYFITIFIKKWPFKISIIYTTFIYMFLYLQPTLLQGFMSLVSVRTISSVSWIQADISYRSDTEQHTTWVNYFVAPNLILWVALLPVGMLVNLVSHKNSLDTTYTRVRWGYFYNEYKLPAFFWEFIKIFQKELIMIFSIFFQDLIIVKGLLIFFVIFIYGALALYIKPYKSKTLNSLDIECTAICAVSMSGGVLSYAAALNGLSNLSYLCLIIISILNIIFIVQMIIVLLSGYSEKFQKEIDAMKDKLLTIRPKLAKELPCLKQFLINHTQMRVRVLYLWGILRYETQQGIKRQRVDKSAPLIQLKFIQEDDDQNDRLIQFDDLCKRENVYIINQMDGPRAVSSTRHDQHGFQVSDLDENEGLVQRIKSNGSPKQLQSQQNINLNQNYHKKDEVIGF